MVMGSGYGRVMNTGLTHLSFLDSVDCGIVLARSALGTNGLALGARTEIECIATVSN